MKAIQTKTEAKAAGKRAPFFKKSGEQGFFGSHRSIPGRYTPGHSDASRSGQPFFSGHPGAGSTIQPKLEVGRPDDAYEKEADHSADKVVRQLSASSEAPGIHSAGPAIHKKPIFESKNDVAEEGVQRKCAACEEEEKLQKKSDPSAATTASPSVESGLRSSKGSGSPLSDATRRQMESSIGADFSGVRIHDNSAARQMSSDLHAQAFTHGKDIYFNSGKYHPGSSGGQHLLAHELTHVVQQTGPGVPKQEIRRKPMSGGKASASRHSGNKAANSTAGPGANESGPGLAERGESTQEDWKDDKEPVADVQRKISQTGLAIQKDGDGDKPGNTSPMGRAEKDGNRYKITLTKFPLKKYANIKSPTPPASSVKPTGERKTKQDQEWRKNVKDKVRENLAELAGKGNEAKMHMVKVKKGGKQGKADEGDQKTQVLGDIDTLTEAIKVLFWDKNGNLTIHQIEHIIDYQLLGTDADTLPDNLILLDKDTNREQGGEVKKTIQERVDAVIQAYNKDAETPIAGNYYVAFEDFAPDAKTVNAKSAISTEEVKKTTADGVIKSNIELRNPCIPKDSCVIRTAIKGEGYIVPYKYKRNNIEIVGNADTKQLISITQVKLIKDSKNIEGATESMPLSFKKEDNLGTDYFRLTKRGYATELKEALKLVGLSPIEFNEEVEVSPLTGLTAEGKVKPDIDFLKDADISFLMEAGEFTVSATIESDVLKGKLPKPLEVDYSDLTIAISTKDPLSVSGSIGFSIKNVGHGVLTGVAGTKGFGIGGKFTFDNAKSFKKAEIGFKYFRENGKGEGKWEGNGELDFDKDVIPGVKKGNIKIGYKDSVLSGAGSFETTIPGIDKVDVTAQFDAAGNFSINGKADLKGIPGIKSSDISVTVTKDENGYSLAMSGTAVPNLPNIPGLGAGLTVSYNKGVFILEGTATYKEGKLDGSVTVGVTNAVIDENGVPAKDTPGDKLKIYGNGTVTLTLLKGLTATLHAAVDEKGEFFIWGDINVNAKPFDPVNIDKQIFKVDTAIPLAGIPFVNVNLRLGTGARFYFHWDPLTIELHATLDRTNIKDMGKAGGELTAKLSSSAKAGIELSVTAGLGVTITVITVSVNITGSVALEINAELGAEAKAKWDLQKGLQLESADAYLKAVPSVVFKLSGDIRAELDLFITTSEIYKKVLGSTQKQLDLNQFAFGVTVPLKIDENGKVQGIDYEKLKVEPSFDEKAGANISDQVLNDDSKGEKEAKEKEAKDKIRKNVSEKLRAKKAEGNANLNEYAVKLKEDILKTTSPDLVGFVDQVIQEELKALGKGNLPAAQPGNPPDPNGSGNPGAPNTPAVAAATPAPPANPAPAPAPVPDTGQ